MKMRLITSSDLADLLNKGFEGEVTFSGNIYCRLRNDKKDDTFDDDKPEPIFYQVDGGGLSLTEAGRCLSGVKAGFYAIRTLNHSFRFKPRNGEEIKSHYNEGYGDVIFFSIDFPVKGVLRIEPKNIFY